MLALLQVKFETHMERELHALVSAHERILKANGNDDVGGGVGLKPKRMFLVCCCSVYLIGTSCIPFALHSAFSVPICLLSICLSLRRLFSLAMFFLASGEMLQFLIVFCDELLKERCVRESRGMDRGLSPLKSFI